MTLRVGSLFSGIGCFDFALERAGMTVAWQCEADKHARAVLRRHWPDTECFEDVQTARPVRGSADLVVGGSPCQDLSIAGRRDGLAGERSGLFWHFVRVVAHVRPRWVLFENVPGLLSSNGGRDFAHVLRALVDCGYGCAWRVLDAQWFGVAQRRRRVFVVGCAAGDARRAAAVLLEPACLCGDSAPSRETGTRVAGSIDTRAKGRGVDVDEADGGRLVASAGHHGHSSPRGDGNDNLVVADALTARDGPGGYCNAGNNPKPRNLVVAATLTGGGAPNSNPPGRRKEDDTNLVATARCLTDPGSPRLDGDTDTFVPSTVGIRRLLPVECERLQGLPDDWTRYATRDEGEVYEQSDTQRYRQIGNGGAVPVVEWIARRMLREERCATITKGKDDMSDTNGERCRDASSATGRGARPRYAP